MINWADRLIDKKVDKITIDPLNVQESGYLVKVVILLIMLSAADNLIDKISIEPKDSESKILIKSLIILIMLSAFVFVLSLLAAS
jgi:hypothetical protein